MPRFEDDPDIRAYAASAIKELEALKKRCENEQNGMPIDIANDVVASFSSGLGAGDRGADERDGADALLAVVGGDQGRVEAAQRFYGGLFGWEFDAGPTQLGPYVRALRDGHPVLLDSGVFSMKGRF